MFNDLMKRNSDINCPMHATLAYLLVTHSNLVSNIDKNHITIERKGKDTRGQLYVFRRLTNKYDTDLGRYKENKHGEMVMILTDYNQA